MISKESVLKMHGLSILKYGGSDGVYNFVIKISTGEIKFEQIVDWLKQNASSL